MSQPGRELQQADAGTVVVRRSERGGQDGWADLRPAFRWLDRRRPVLLVALVLIVAQVAWRAQFLGQMYFYRDDFFNIDFAKGSSFGWHYLTYVGTGHLMIGERAIIWVFARIALYNWTLASIVSLALLATAGLAAFMVLRTLFGERPAILVPLALYLLSPLGVAAFGWWTVALESVPLQLATFMALNSHVRYVRTRQMRHLVAAATWVAFGMLAFEKGLIVPVLLFAVTSAFLCGGGSWLTGARRAAAAFWRAWLSYAVIVVAFLVVLAISLRTSTSHPAVPGLSAALTFSWQLVKDVLLPGTIGGPWGWWSLPGRAYALAAPPSPLTWVALVVVVVLVVGTILRRRLAWRAWVTLAVWVVLADIGPVIIARLNWYPILLALDTRYVADAMPAAIICVGLAFLPMARRQAASTSGAQPETVGGASQPPRAAQQRAWRVVVSGVFGVFVVGAIWSTGSYQSATTGQSAASYISRAQRTVAELPRSTAVLDSPLPDQLQDAGNSTRQVIGAIQLGMPRWVEHPRGTIDGLQVFGLDGRLHPVWVYGASTGRPSVPRGCWPERRGKIVLRFLGKPPYLTTVLRIGYIWGSHAPGVIFVSYGQTKQELTVRPGLHSAFLPVSGSAARITVSGLAGSKICVGDAEAGSAQQVRPHQGQT